MTRTELAIKVDVDTERGTRLGVPALVRLLDEFNIPATFLFSLGPDNTGRAIKRLFRPGFFNKAMRTGVVGIYGARTLLNGVLWPGPHIGRRHAVLMRAVHDAGHEVGIHCYDHIRWQDGLASMKREKVFAEFAKACTEFERIYGEPPRTAGAAGWQANAFSLEAYDTANLLYASDARGTSPFYPRAGGHVFKTLQVPTTLPTLDELLGRPAYVESQLADQYLSWLQPGQLNVLTAHAEIEGMKSIAFFRRLLERALERAVSFVRMDHLARAFLEKSEVIPICDLVLGEVDGRSGRLAVQQVTSH